MKLPTPLTWSFFGLLLLLCAGPDGYAQRAFHILVSAPKPAGLKSGGRLMVWFSKDSSEQPMYSMDVEDVPHSGQLFAQDIRWNGSATLDLNSGFAGFPLSSPAALDTGTWYVQAVYDSDTMSFSRYAPGNFYSAPVKLVLVQNDPLTVKLTLDSVFRETMVKDSALVRFVRIRSARLSAFWHRDMYVRAAVLLPSDYDSAKPKKYPVCYDVGGYSARFTRVLRYMKDSAFSAFWRDPASPKMLMVFLDSDAPFGDCYQMNSENNGPYMEVLKGELIPVIEKKFHAMATPGSRFLEGGSTGGWVTLALQILNPDFFNGCWSSYPDPVDFHFYQLVDLYAGGSAFVNRFGQEISSSRTVYGEVKSTVRSEMAYENTLGRGNSYICSGLPWGAWNAVYSPRGSNGLPVPVWDPNTGQIDRRVVAWWHSRWDLRQILADNWKKLGPQLQGRIHIYVGDMDTYYLNDAVRLLKTFLDQTTAPKSDAEIIFGPMQVHGWQAISDREMFRQMMQRVH